MSYEQTIEIDTGDYLATLRLSYTATQSYTPTDRGCIVGLEIDDIGLAGDSEDLGAIVWVQQAMDSRYLTLHCDRDDPQAIAEFRVIVTEEIIHRRLEEIAQQLAQNHKQKEAEQCV
jgi:hypothetical protein